MSVGEAVQHGGGLSPGVRGLLDGLPAYEAACHAVEAARLGDPAQSATLLARWFEGVALLDALSRVKSDPEPRLTAAMTHLATAWLSPRSVGEPRTVTRERIPSLRPIEQSEPFQDLMGKNNEGTLTPDERREFLRLHEFYDTLQSVLTEAIHATFPRMS